MSSFMSRRRILHIDINSYFAILLQQENPKLRGKPVGVVKSAGRHLIIAASKEAKEKGVKTGMALREARQLCPSLISVPAEFDFYLSATRKFYDLLKKFTPNFYPFSLDEAFLDITNMERIYPSAKELGHQIQDKVKEVLGEWVTCNVGISHTYLLAKIAGEISPKGSVTEITAETKDNVLKRVGFDDVCGVGRGLSNKLHQLGVTTPYQIRSLPEEVLVGAVGPFWAKELRFISQGEDSCTLRALDTGNLVFKSQMKSVSRSVTGYRLCDSETEIRSIIYNLTQEVCFKARSMNLAGRHLALMLQGSNRSYGSSMTYYNHCTLKKYLNLTDDVFFVIYNQLYKNWKRSFKVIRYLVRLSDLTLIDQQSLPLFEADRKKEKVYQAMDKLAEKYGLFTVRSGVLIDTPVLRPEVTGYFGDKGYYLQ